jgi:hypothetical protein
MWYPGNLIFPEPRKEEKHSPDLRLKDAYIAALENLYDVSLIKFGEVLNGRVHDSTRIGLARKK